MSEKVSVIGAGTMGHGIAQISAMAGYSVMMYDISREILDQAVQRIRSSLDKFRSKGVVSSVEEVLSRIRTSTSLEEVLSGSDYIIEAVPEVLELKKDIFRKAEQHAPSARFYGTNTSSLPITEISEAISKRDRVVGVHFFNPPQLMKLVEVIRGAHTSDETLREALGFSERLGKTPVVVNRDVPGFIVNRLLARLMNASCHVVEAGLATVIEVDSAVKHKLGYPMGVFELADYSGIDVFYLVFRAMKERGFEGDVCRTFEEMYRQGKLGVKSGSGFYSYPGRGVYVKPSIPQEAGAAFDPWLVVSPEVAEALYLIKNGITVEKDVDVATMLGLGYRKGLMSMAREYGLDKVKEKLAELSRLTGRPEYGHLMSFM
ncbi:MAG: 3-hydroxyacyl-CoA dehydrogenase NAD-binding domain-containing protein [Nitrososphaeria archaeon]